MEDYGQKTAAQLGIVEGDYNVDPTADRPGFVWIGAHLGSHRLRHTSATR